MAMMREGGGDRGDHDNNIALKMLMMMAMMMVMMMVTSC